MRSTAQSNTHQSRHSLTSLRLALQHGKQERKFEGPEKAAHAAGKRIVAAMKKAREETK